MSADKRKMHDRAMALYNLQPTHNIIVNRIGRRQFHKASDWPELQYLIDNKYVTRARVNSFGHSGYTIFEPTQKWFNELKDLV